MGKEKLENEIGILIMEVNNIKKKLKASNEKHTAVWKERSRMV